MPTKKALKIFVDGYLLNKEHQGTKTYIKEIYKEFAKQNPSVLIYIGCFKDQSIEDEFSKYNNIKFIYFTQSKRILRMLSEIPKIITHYKFDYAHFQYVIPFFKSKSCKYIVTIHDILFNDFPQFFSLSYRIKRNFLFRISAKKSDVLLTVSEYSKQRIQEFYGLNNKEIGITPNGVSKLFFKDYNKKQSQDYIYKKYKVNNYLLYVSRIEPRKNQQALLKIFPDIDDKNTKIVFIGSKTLDNKTLDKEYNNLPYDVKKRVHFFNSISNNDLLEFYKAATVFVYPTFAEGFGIPPLEAAALKIPVVCSNKTALSDFNFFKPYHVNIENVNELKQKINELLKHKNKADLIEIQNQIKEYYTWEKSSRTFAKIINIHS
ncbi:glycosyltransferase family 4 protein [Polaribacter sp. M15]